MKAIRKLNIVFRLSILFMIIPFFYLYFKENIVYAIAFISLVLIFFLLRIFVFGKKFKYKDLEQEYAWVPLGYVFGGIFLLMAILASFGTISDIRQGAPIPLWMIVALSGVWIFGFFLIYYAYKSQKESRSVIRKKEKPEEIFSKEKVKKFWLYYLIVFMIIASILRYIFKATPFTLTNMIITIAVIVFMYFYLRIALQSRKDDSKKKKYRVWFVILIFLLIFFGTLVYTLMTGPDISDKSDKCVSRGIFPKNGIPGLQYCEEDSDCIKIINRDSCCDACTGGRDNAINKEHIDFWECVRLKDKSCNEECEANVTSWTCFAQAGCVNNICEVIEESAIYNLEFSDFECKQNQAECHVNCTWKVYNEGNRPTRYRLNISFYDEKLGRSVHNAWEMLYPEVPIYQDRIDEYNKDYNCELGEEGFEYKKEFTQISIAGENL